MTDLERRALLGDKQAQEECTRQGIVLPCPCCGGKAKKSLLLGRFGIACTECPVCVVPSPYGEPFEENLKYWNTRPAPPIGLCKDCGNTCESKHDGCVVCLMYGCHVENDNSCKQWEPKEE